MAAVIDIPRGFSAEEEFSDDPPVVRALEEIERQAATLGASDVHIERGEPCGRIRVRVDGELRELRRLDHELCDRVVARIKLLAKMDVADRRLPQDGRYAFTLENRRYDVRVSSLPTVFGEKIVLRVLDCAANVPYLDGLGMPPDVLHGFREMLGTRGCIFVCGPTGSGKTTTLYAALNERNTPGQQLCTIEDPVEIELPGVAQVQVHVRSGLTYTSALRAIVRQDPDAVMIGEVRDSETAHAVLAAGLAGHLVLSTLHAHDAVSSIERLTEFGVSRRTIGAALGAMLAQRLVRVVDKSGRFVGRTGVFSLCVLDDRARDAIANAPTIGEMRAAIRSCSTVDLRERALDLVGVGATTAAEVMRVFGSGLP